MTFGKVFDKDFNKTFSHPLGELSDFVPSDLASNVLWLNANKGITLNGPDVSAWDDQSGNGNDAAQAMTQAQPVFSATAFTGYPTVVFNSFNENLEYLIIPDSNSLDLDDNFTSFIVGSIDDTTLFKHFFSKNFDNGYRFRVRNDEFLQTLVNDEGGGPNQANNSASAVATDTPLIMQVNFRSGSNVDFYINGVADGSSSNTLLNIMTGTLPLLIGATNSVTPTEFYSGLMSQVLLFDEVPTTLEQNQIGRYLASLYPTQSWTDIT